MIGWPTVRHHWTISNLILRWIFRHLNATNIDITTEKRELCAICCGQTENIQHQRQIMCELTVFFPLFATSLIVFYRRELSPHILFELVFVFGTIWIHLKGISFVLTDGSMIFFFLWGPLSTISNSMFDAWNVQTHALQPLIVMVNKNEIIPQNIIFKFDSQEHIYHLYDTFLRNDKYINWPFVLVRTILSNFMMELLFMLSTAIELMKFESVIPSFHSCCCL